MSLQSFVFVCGCVFVSLGLFTIFVFIYWISLVSICVSIVVFFCLICHFPSLCSRFLFAWGWFLFLSGNFMSVFYWFSVFFSISLWSFCLFGIISHHFVFILCACGHIIVLFVVTFPFRSCRSVHPPFLTVAVSCLFVVVFYLNVMVLCYVLCLCYVFVSSFFLFVIVLWPYLVCFLCLSAGFLSVYGDFLMCS